MQKLIKKNDSIFQNFNGISGRFLVALVKIGSCHKIFDDN